MLSAPAGGWRACSNTDRMQHGKVRFLRGKVRFVQREPPSEKGRGSRSSGSPCRACCEDVPVLCFEDGIIYRVECSALGERGIPLQLPQDRVAADWHAQPVVSKRQPGASAGTMAEQTNNLRDSPCPVRIRRSSRRRSVGERLSFAILMCAPPSAQCQGTVASQGKIVNGLSPSQFYQPSPSDIFLAAFFNRAM